MTPQQYDKLNSVIERKKDLTIKQYENQIVKYYKSALKDIKGILSDMYASNPNPTFSEMVKYNRLLSYENQIAERLNELKSPLQEQIKFSIEDSYKEAYQTEYYKLEQYSGVSLNFTILPTIKIESALFNPYDRIKWTTRNQQHINDLNNKVKQSITRGLTEGKTLYQVSKDIQSSTEKTAYQSMRIARTESLRASNTAQTVVYDRVTPIAEKYGLKTYKVWLSAMDNRTRDTHAQANQQHSIDGLFTVNGYKCQCPHDSSLPASEVINCRCTFKTEFEGLNGAIKNETMSYDEWLKMKGSKQ